MGPCTCMHITRCIICTVFLFLYSCREREYMRPVTLTLTLDLALTLTPPRRVAVPRQ